MEESKPNLKQWLLENCEAVLLAIIIALIVRHFCLEAFKIPSCSMEPTLIGDPRCGDRILVHKGAYLLHPPERWDVIVFKYPNDRSRNFIKRLIGLEGEQVDIKNGDIYIDGDIARKPDAVQEALLYPVSILEQKPSRDVWISRGGKWSWREDSLVVVSQESAWYQYLHRITNRYSPRHDNLFFNRRQRADEVGGDHEIGEVRLRFTLRVLEPKGSVAIQAREGIYRFHLTLPVEGSGKTAGSLLSYVEEEHTPRQKVEIDRMLALHRKYALTFSNLDDLVSVELNGRRIAALDYSQPFDKVPRESYETNVRFGISSGKCEFSGIELWRDIYYLGGGDLFCPVSWKVPRNHYFVLGDNPPNSRDSRDWERFCLYLKSGISIQGDQSRFPDPPFYEFVDIYGDKWKLTQDQLRYHTLNNLKAPFVPGEELLGQAFMVFWPPTRMKIIR